jgi:uncharacterized membrane protein
MSVSPQPTESSFLPVALPAVEQNETTRPARRIDSIDLLRGIVMVIMMLDHTRDFVHNAALQFPAEDLSRTNVWLFFTRWITHFCAPVFVFLAGTGSYLQIARGKSRGELSRFLITRGLWLIILEVTVVRFGVVFNFDLKMLAFLQVIWVIGVSMIVLAALIYLPLSVIGAFGVLMIALHNLLDRLSTSEPPVPPTLGVKIGMLLHQQGGFPVGENHLLFVVYPLIPWIGVMAAGYAFGALYQMDSQRRKRILLALGGCASLLFVIIRLINRYGDPSTWSPQGSPLFTLLSFFNTTKYPPSLLYLLMTLGPAIIFLALAEVNLPDTSSTQSSGSWLRRAFVTFGRVPLFFYFLQWYTAHLISIGLHYAFGKPTDWLFQTPLDWFSKPHPGIGFNLAVVYAAWFTGLLVIYPLCKWFAGVKARRKDWWLSYL